MADLQNDGREIHFKLIRSSVEAPLEATLSVRPYGIKIVSVVSQLESHNCQSISSLILSRPNVSSQVVSTPAIVVQLSVV